MDAGTSHEMPLPSESSCPTPVAPSPSQTTQTQNTEKDVEQLDPDFRPIIDENGKSKSFVWRHFKETDDGKHVKCNYCGQLYKYDMRKLGLANPGNHIKKLLCTQFRLKKSSEDVARQKCLTTETVVNSDGTVTRNVVLSRGATVPDQKTCRTALTVMVILDELPFSHVENPGFRHFCGTTLPHFNIPSRQTVARDVLELHLREWENLIKYFKEKRQRFCLTTDTWTSIQNINYMVVTAHYVDDDWCVQKRILSFSVIPNHKGETIARMIEVCLREWQIGSIFTITADNASANETAITSLKRKLVRNENALVLGGEFMHLRCAAHILNLIVNDGLKEKIVGINAIRNCVKYVKSSPPRLAKFKEIAIDEQIDCKSLLQFDVPTRWNSTYLMLETALKFRKVFERLYDEDGSFRYYFEQSDGESKRDGPPSEEDWDSVCMFINFLKKFYDLTLKFSVSTGVTSVCYFHSVWQLQIDLSNQSKNAFNPLLQRMAVDMKKKFDKYWGSLDTMNPLLVVAVVLDPRYKLEYVEFTYFEAGFDESTSNDIANRVKRVLERLYEWYAAAYPSPNVGDESDSGINSSDMCSSTIVVDKWTMRMKKRKIEKTSERFKVEINKYLDDEMVVLLGEEKFDIMCWWKANADRYRILALIARDIFAMPVSTIASEAAFSTSGRVLDPYRSSLNPRTVEALICTQNWLRSNKVLVANPSASSISSTSSAVIADAEEMSLMDMLESEVYGQVPSSSLHSVSESVM